MSFLVFAGAVLNHLSRYLFRYLIYSIPVSTNQAKIIVSNAAGHTIKTFSISNKGAGTITINANTLASGVYNYALWPRNVEEEDE